MTQRGLEDWNRPGDGHRRDQDPSAPNAPDPPSRSGSSFGDSSWPLFSMYSQIAEEEDKKMTDRWQKDADGILIFTGLFSASVAALLAVSVQDLRPNSQDISAFYLGNIYQILADPNATLSRTFTPFPVAKPPPFSPPTYAVWVNSLWFLSLVISLTCALLATSLHQWARRYVRNTQPARCSPEKRARMRAFFAGGMDNMHVPWAVETLPALIHLSLFLFFAGLLIFLFNVNHAVFSSVTWWIGAFLTIYGWVTLMPIFRQDSPYYAPFSSTAWLLYTSLLYALFTGLERITFGGHFSHQIWERFNDLSDRYQNRIKGGMLKTAEKTVTEQSSEIDLRILDWTMNALGEDDTLEKFFEYIPGFFDSQLVKDHLERPPPFPFRSKLQESLGGFLGRTLLSNSISEEVKIRRLVICMNVTKEICDFYAIPGILWHLCRLRLDKVPQPIETGQILARYCAINDQYTSVLARRIVASILTSVRDRDGRWIALAKDQFGLSERFLWDNVAFGDNSVLLAILIHMTRQATLTDPQNSEVLSSLSNFDIHDTLPRLQHEFCALWNQIVLDARNEGIYCYPVFILRQIRHAFIALHQGTDASTTAFSASTPSGDSILAHPSSYPLCNISTHRPNSAPCPLTTFPTVFPPTQVRGPHDVSVHLPRFEEQPIPGVSTTSPQTEEVDIVVRIASHKTSVNGRTAPSMHESLQTIALQLNPLVSMEVDSVSSLSVIDNTANGVHPDALALDVPIDETDASQTPVATVVAFPQPESTVSYPPSVSVRQPGDFIDTPSPATSALTLSYTLDISKQQDIVVAYAASDTTQISSTVNHSLQSIPNVDGTLQTSEESTGVPLPIVSGSRLSPIMVPAFQNSVVPKDIPSFEGSALVRPGHLSLPTGSLSSSLATVLSDNTPHVPSVLDTYVTESNGAIVPLSSPDTAEHTLLLGDHPDGFNEL